MRGFRQGAPSTTRCIKTQREQDVPGGRGSRVREHPAPPGALRRSELDLRRLLLGVREHPAPPGALRRRIRGHVHVVGPHVREHPAPPGALRLRNEVGRDLRGDVGQGAPSTIRCIKTPEPPEPPTGTGPRQGAPSTIRCIKTRDHSEVMTNMRVVREHLAPSGALRPHSLSAGIAWGNTRSGSTQHHQVH